ncbi:LADA_0A03730g1_1 [Lachancea dasiensis]|uniref:Acyl-coenzyme A diphosphatase SCS3 n=1 Tax=Lachancea dasiensis TaxID=1072105 RepID=A0A1G4INQ1_9SACH|nr:LADA_0A03730g1_1 [Lachancea dasiensis]
MVLSYYKVFLFTLCPATLVVGHLISRQVTLVVDKDSWFNIYFVKQGWFWTSLVGWWCMIRYSGFGQRGSWRRTLLRYSVLTAWWMLFTQSIWSEAAPLMDLVFTATGGRCNFDVFDTSGSLPWQINEKFQDTLFRKQSSLRKIYKALKGSSTSPSSMLQNAVSEIEYWISEGKDNLRNIEVTPSQINNYIDEALHSWRKINSSNICRSLGGHWIGGHDPSGHIFLITLMCMFLLGELQVIGRKALRKMRTDGTYWPLVQSHLKSFLMLDRLRQLIADPPTTWKLLLRQVGTDVFKNCEQIMIFLALTLKYLVWDNPVVLLVALIFMWWWSFLITTIAFHTLSEQISGLLCAYIVAAIVYWKLI